jgi:hypothetical protein
LSVSGRETHAVTAADSKLTTSPNVPSARAPESARAGFQAQIKGVSLEDLVQMECLACSHRAVRVTSGSNVGYLYFRGGAVVHATARLLAGEAAALEILAWSEGSFEAIDREWPAKETIACTWQSLLLRAAQRRDERSLQSVVALRSIARPAGRQEAASPMQVPEGVEFQATPIEIAGHVFRSEDFQVVVRLGANGTLTLNRGGTQDFADIVAYACRLSELIGTQLGAEGFAAMECALKTGRCYVVVEPSGDVVALRPHPSSDCGALRNLLGI